MRLPILIGSCLFLAIASLFAKNSEFSQNRDLPPLRLAAADLDIVLHKTHALIAAANGPTVGQGSARESVTLGVRGHEIEIRHFSLASSVAFPRELFRFSYSFRQPDKPISSVTMIWAITRVGYRSLVKPPIKSKQSRTWLRRICFAIQPRSGVQRSVVSLESVSQLDLLHL
jgi:hypothetical protein